MPSIDEHIELKSNENQVIFLKDLFLDDEAKTVDALLDEWNALKEGSIRTDVDSKKKMLYTLINIVSTSFFTALFGALAIIVIGVCKLMLQLDALGTWGQYFLFAILITMGAMDIPQKWAGFLLFTSYLFTLTSSKTPYGIFGK